uniref:UVR domain-containing protein n=1 Tax=Alexandrium monilatum TaxID=311494 RepID=A0A7S4Q9N9_9DINO
MAGRAPLAGVLACAGVGLLCCGVQGVFREPAFTAPGRRVAPGVQRLGKAAVSLGGGQTPRQRRSDGGCALGLAALVGLHAAARRASPAGRGSPRRWRRPRRAEGSGSASGSGSGNSEATGGTGADTPEATPNELVEELESQMHKLARAGKYEDAAVVRDKLSNAQVDDEARVLLANTELYTAFSDRNIERMRALWLPASYVQCIHPYEKRAAGYSDVCASWQRLFEAAKSAPSVVSAEDVRVLVRGATATIVCTERVTSKALKTTLHSMIATNIFRKVDGKWHLVHRHVSAAGDSAWGAPLLDDQMTAPDISEDSVMAWMSQAAGRFPVTKIIIQDASGKRFNMGEDEDFHPRVIDAMEIGDEDTDDSGMESDEDSDMDDMLVDEEENGMEIARDTVRALRRLSKQGLLTARAKIQLMSEMLRNPGESMPERAHELLLVDVPEDEKDAAWEDFAALVAMEARRLDARKAKASESGERKKPNGSGQGKGRGR